MKFLKTYFPISPCAYWLPRISKQFHKDLVFRAAIIKVYKENKVISDNSADVNKSDWDK